MVIPADIKKAISVASATTKVSEPILMAFAQIESNFNVKAKSEKTNNRLGGVRGLFQITGDTWKGVWKEQGNPNKPYSTDATQQAITAGYLISGLAKKYKNNFNLVAIAYNAGTNVATALIGKELNEVNIRKAVASYYSDDQIDAKSKEVYNYPIKFMAAMGGVFHAGDTNFSGSEAITNTQPNVIARIDPNKSFILNLMGNSNETVNRFSGVISKLDKGSLRAKIVKSQKLTNLIKTAPESAGS